MFKYLYLLGLLFSFFTFMVGFNNYKEYETFTLFNIGLMSLTPIVTFLLTTVYLKRLPEEDENL